MSTAGKGTFDNTCAAAAGQELLISNWRGVYIFTLSN